MDVVDVVVHVSSHLKEELAWAVDKLLVLYRKVWLLGTCAYIFRRNILLNLPYLLSACAYMGYC